MSKKILLYNFNFMTSDQFSEFEFSDYIFTPILEKQPHPKDTISLKDTLIYNRYMTLNSYVLLKNNQINSIIRAGSKYPNDRKVKFFDDILMFISILIGRNVVPKSYKNYNNFPPLASNHCEIVSRNSSELRSHLELINNRVKDQDWQNKFDNGYHIKMLYNNSNIFVREPRFLSFTTIWEYLYARENQNKSFKQILDTCLDHKIAYLLRKYLLSIKRKNLENRIKIFRVIRNQLTHSGDLPVNCSEFNKHLSVASCYEYMKLFEHLTQLLVLKTLGLDAFDNLQVFNIREHLDELSTSGVINSIER